jgi:SAM-dependent methyltransferase
MKRRLYFFLRRFIYPGLDLHVRSRALLSRFWAAGDRRVLDAGCGNGYFSWLAYRSGARVLGLSFDGVQVHKAGRFLLEELRADPSRLAFEQRNLYHLDTESRTFDEIICYEVLEHLDRDREVLAHFHRLLQPGGVLHLCCPNRAHPRHQREVLDTTESGGHVRPGYVEEDYRELLEPLGFRIERVVGVGSRALYLCDEVVRAVRSCVGDWAALPLFWAALPVVWMERLDPPTPFSLYVKAVKAR